MSHQPRVFQLENENVELLLSESGASLLSCRVRAEGSFQEVLRGERDPELRAKSLPYYNAIIGRSANRIGKSRYEYKGQVIRLEPNEGQNHLHGASSGLHLVNWMGEKADENSVDFSYISPSGTAGYPGNLSLKVSYILLDKGLEIKMTASSDEVTPVNLTHHNYFNLCPEASTILEQKLRVNASHYTPTDRELIPTGEIASLDGHALDLRRPRTLADILSGLPEGLDHNYVLDSKDPAAILERQDGSLALSLYTDLPGLQIYSCNQAERLADGQILPVHFALCLEPQFFPDAVNHKNFPSPLLKPGEVYQHFIRYQFHTTEDLCKN